MLIDGDNGEQQGEGGGGTRGTGKKKGMMMMRNDEEIEENSKGRGKRSKKKVSITSGEERVGSIRMPDKLDADKQKMMNRDNDG